MAEGGAPTPTFCVFMMELAAAGVVVPGVVLCCEVCVVICGGEATVFCCVAVFVLVVAAVGVLAVLLLGCTLAAVPPCCLFCFFLPRRSMKGFQ